MTQDPDTPISSAQSVSLQSRHALRVLQQHDVLSYHCAVNMRDPGQVDRLRARLGPDVELPTDDGVYYLVFVRQLAGLPDGVQRWHPFFIPEGSVTAAAVMAALPYGRELAEEVKFQLGILPDASVSAVVDGDAVKPVPDSVDEIIFGTRVRALRAAHAAEVDVEPLLNRVRNGHSASVDEQRRTHQGLLLSGYATFTAAVLGMLRAADPDLAVNAAALLDRIFFRGDPPYLDDIVGRLDEQLPPETPGWSFFDDEPGDG